MNREKGKVIGGTKGNKILDYVSGAPNKEQVIEQAPNVFDYDELTRYGYGVSKQTRLESALWPFRRLEYSSVILTVFLIILFFDCCVVAAIPVEFSHSHYGYGRSTFRLQSNGHGSSTSGPSA